MGGGLTLYIKRWLGARRGGGRGMNPPGAATPAGWAAPRPRGERDSPTVEGRADGRHEEDTASLRGETTFSPTVEGREEKPPLAPMIEFFRLLKLRKVASPGWASFHQSRRRVALGSLLPRTIGLSRCGVRGRTMI